MHLGAPFYQGIGDNLDGVEGPGNPAYCTVWMTTSRIPVGLRPAVSAAWVWPRSCGSRPPRATRAAMAGNCALGQAQPWAGINIAEIELDAVAGQVLRQPRLGGHQPVGPRLPHKPRRTSACLGPDGRPWSSFADMERPPSSGRTTPVMLIDSGAAKENDRLSQVGGTAEAPRRDEGQERWRAWALSWARGGVSCAPGASAIDGYAVLGHFDGQCLGQADHSRLGRGVGGRPSDQAPAGDGGHRGDVDDPT